MRCDECKWWRQIDNGSRHTKVGTCKRMPPSAVPMDDAEAVRKRWGRAVWPVMYEDDFCGEFEPR